MVKIQQKRPPFQFSLNDYLRLKRNLIEIYMIGHGEWPVDPEKWFLPEGCPEYLVRQITQKNIRPFIIIKFSEKVRIPDGREAYTWRIGGEFDNKTPIF